MYINRTLEYFIKKVDRKFPVLLLAGARQVGKTTLFQHLKKQNRTFITLDDPIILHLAKEDPALFFQRYSPPLLIDEIQYAPELLPYIKMDVDKNHSPGRYWLTGSQQFHLMKGITESLAGRVGIINLLGFSRSELIKKSKEHKPFLPLSTLIKNRIKIRPPLSLNELYRLIWIGSYPMMSLEKHPERDLFYSSYVQTYIQRDVRNLTNVGNEMTFLRFLRTAAARSGQILNFSDLARDSDISVNTAKRWLSVLQTSGIIYLLEPWHSNITKRLIKAPKLYFLDTGLCAYLTEWSSPKTLEIGAMSGPILETWILSELLKSYWHNGKNAPFYYYRDKDKKEIDLLIIQDGFVYPLEFKKTASPRKSDIGSFQLLRKKNVSVGAGGVICLTEELFPLTKFDNAIPVSVI